MLNTSCFMHADIQ